MFCVGDGLTGTGTGQVQTFSIPDGATRMYFGLMDRNGAGNPPDFYGDNTGSIDIAGTIIVP